MLIGAMEHWCPVWLEIDAKGKVTSIRCSNVTASQWAERLQRWIQRFSFEPGKVDGKQKAMRLPGTLILSLADSTAALVLPVNHRKEVADYDLYIETLESNGRSLPALEYFPWYYSDISRTDTARMLPFVLLDISLDSAGDPMAVSIARTNYPTFAAQLATAANYAKYRLPTADVRSSGGNVSVAVTFFPNSHYPTRPWTMASLDSLDLHDRYALRLLPARIGTLLRKPLPVARGNWEYRLPVPAVVDRKGLVVEYRIDTTGLATPQLDSLRAPELYSFAASLGGRMSFYPALDFTGNLVPYSGYIQITAINRSVVRVQCLWLNSW